MKKLTRITVGTITAACLMGFTGPGCSLPAGHFATPATCGWLLRNGHLMLATGIGCDLTVIEPPAPNPKRVPRRG